MFQHMEGMAQRVGRRVALLRTRRPGRRLTQDLLAKRIGVSGSFLRKIENGERPLPLLLVEPLSRELGVTPHDLLCGAGREGQDERLLPVLAALHRLGPSDRQVRALVELIESFLK